MVEKIPAFETCSCYRRMTALFFIVCNCRTVSISDSACTKTYVYDAAVVLSNCFSVVLRLASNLR